MKALALLSLKTLIAVGSAPAALIGTSHMGEGGTNSFTIDQEFSSSDGTGFRDYTGFVFSHQSGNEFEFGGSFLDEGASVFLVNPGEPFSDTGIETVAFVRLSLGTTYTFPSSFFLGIRTPHDEWDTFPSPFPPAFGWAEFSNSGDGELQIINHAVAYESEGIIVGTTTGIPEPTPLLFVHLDGFPATLQASAGIQDWHLIKPAGWANRLR